MPPPNPSTVSRNSKAPPGELSPPRPPCHSPPCSGLISEPRCARAHSRRPSIPQRALLADASRFSSPPRRARQLLQSPPQGRHRKGSLIRSTPSISSIPSISPRALPRSTRRQSPYCVLLLPYAARFFPPPLRPFSPAGLGAASGSDAAAASASSNTFIVALTASAWSPVGHISRPKKPV